VGPQAARVTVVAVCPHLQEEIMDRRFTCASYFPRAAAAAAATSAVAIVGLASSRVVAQVRGPSTLQTPYIVPSIPGVITKSILSNGNGTTTPDEVHAKTGGGSYRFVGIPDGLGWYDNGNNTFTLLSNHELGATVGTARDHGTIGAFVSEWIINKADLSVVSGHDLMQTANLWNGAGYSPAPAGGVNVTNTVTASLSGSGAFGRLCSADLPAVSAFYNPASGLGTQNRIYMNGEESGVNGRSLAHVATGPAKGQSFELPRLGRWSVENNLSSPFAQDKTIVIGNADDGANPGIWMYVGQKQNAGNDIERAGLTNGNAYVLKVNGVAAETRSSGLGASGYTTSGTFGWVSLGNLENVPTATQQSNGLSGGATTFLRPEDGAWDPRPGHQNDYYFVTTDRFNTITHPSNPGGPANQDGRARLWRIRYDDITNPTAGGSIEMMLDGGATNFEMFDNMTIDKHGRILLNEDPGNTAYRGKVWLYDIDSGNRGIVAEFDSARWGDNSGAGGSLVGGMAPFVTGTATSDKETTGIIDASDLLGDGWFLVNIQAHYAQSGAKAAELVEGGQLVAMYVPPGVVPEPASLSAMAMTVALLTVRRRRRGA
jgi:hypothetical protein